MARWVTWYAEGVPGDPDSLANLAFGIREHTEGTPEREAKLAEIAARIRSGTYHVEPDELAEKLLREVVPPDSELK